MGAVCQTTCSLALVKSEHLSMLFYPLQVCGSLERFQDGCSVSDDMQSCIGEERTPLNAVLPLAGVGCGEAQGYPSVEHAQPYVSHPQEEPRRLTGEHEVHSEAHTQGRVSNYSQYDPGQLVRAAACTLAVNCRYEAVSEGASLPLVLKGNSHLNLAAALCTSPRQIPKTSSESRTGGKGSSIKSGNGRLLNVFQASVEGGVGHLSLSLWPGHLHSVH